MLWIAHTIIIYNWTCFTGKCLRNGKHMCFFTKSTLTLRSLILYCLDGNNGDLSPPCSPKIINSLQTWTVVYVMLVKVAFMKPNPACVMLLFLSTDCGDECRSADYLCIKDLGLNFQFRKSFVNWISITCIYTISFMTDHV